MASDLVGTPHRKRPTPMRKYTVSDFIRDFPTNKACLEYLKGLRWPDGIRCKKCADVTEHYLIESRKCYSCAGCRTQVYPTAGTIFHKSRTPLPVWFYVVFQMAQTRGGIAAKEIERETGVTYKAAWRMCQLVRAALAESGPAGFTGTVEVDETFVGARKPRYKGQRKVGRPSLPDKQPVVGIVERDGAVRAYVVPDVKRETVFPLITGNVEAGATIYTDEYAVYRALPAHGYEHDVVRHKVKQYAKQVVDETTGEIKSVHTNTIEGFWSHMKGGVNNVHKGVSRRYLQRYVDEFAYRYSNRKAETPMFTAFMERIASAGHFSAMLPASAPA